MEIAVSNAPRWKDGLLDTNCREEELTEGVKMEGGLGSRRDMKVWGEE